MKIAFVNPFEPIELSEKITEITVKIGAYNYVVRQDNVDTTSIDFDERLIKINNSLDSKACLRELIRAFFIIIAYEFKFDTTFPSGRKSNLNDISYATCSWYFMNWFDEDTFYWSENKPYPEFYNIGGIQYKVFKMQDISYEVTQAVQYGTSNHMLGIIYIMDKYHNTEVSFDVKYQTFWHEYVHTLFTISNEYNANDIEYVVDNYGTQISLFMKQFMIKI